MFEKFIRCRVCVVKKNMNYNSYFLVKMFMMYYSDKNFR